MPSSLSLRSLYSLSRASIGTSAFWCVKPSDTRCRGEAGAYEKPGVSRAPDRSCEARAESGTGLTMLSVNYCFEPVVLLFGFGEQLRFCGFASFSQAAMLAYLQLRPPPDDIFMQNAEFPTVWGFCMLPDGGAPI